jgi:acyl-CoA synthetase (AMP-forming)/AMP-acid ligase II
MLLYEIIDKIVEENPGKKAVICGKDSCTYGRLFDRMNLWAKTLLSIGIKRGDRVALFMKNRVELVQLYFACFRIGAIAVPLNTRYKTPETIYALKQSGSKILIASSDLYPVVENILDNTPSLKHIYIIDEDSKHKSLSWKKATTDSEDHINFPEVNISDPAIIIYTSGTTGRPKGAVHSHYSLLNLILNKKKSQEIGQYEISLAATQISHIAGFAGLMLTTLSNGGTLVMVSEFNPADYIKCLKKYKPTFTVLLPTELLEILEHPNAKDADFSNLRSMMVAGDKVPHHIYDFFRKLTGFDLMEGCGMTECEGYCIQPKNEKKKPGSIGKPISGVQIRLVDSNGNDVPVGKTGEIYLKSKSVISNYWNNPEETKKAFGGEWFRTGDLAYKDEDGYYHFVSRIKEIIIRGGSNITPGEIEDILDDYPKVESSGVVGFPDDHYGSIVGAFIVPKPGMPAPTIDELSAFVSKNLAQYKLPEKWIFVKRLPKNAVGKIDRKELHNLAEKHISKS